MKIETICTGDELLTGLIADTNSVFFQEALLALGEKVRRSVVVGDVREDIIEAMKMAAERCDAVLVSGGLGPTADDLTAECAAKAAGVELVENGAALAHLEAIFQRLGRAVTPNNRKQALVPQGSEVVVNPKGTAPMFITRIGGCPFFFVPGVPREYRFLVETQVLPRLETMRGEKGPKTYRRLKVLKCSRLPESVLDAKVAPLAKVHPQVTFGFRTHGAENHLKLLGQASSQAELERVLEAATAEAREVLREHLFAEDDETLVGVVSRLLRERTQTVAVAESLTGGLVSAALTSLAGSSELFVGAAVTYQTRTKAEWLEVSDAALENGPVNEATAREMARGARKAFGADWALSTTGFAGPTGGTAEAPVGTVFIAVAGPGIELCERYSYGIFDRTRVREYSAHTALDVLRRAMLMSNAPA